MPNQYTVKIVDQFFQQVALHKQVPLEQVTSFITDLPQGHRVIIKAN
jgi:hypothetical protein